VQEEVVKLPDWIQELYLKEMVYKGTEGEKTHDKHGRNVEETKADNGRDKKLPKKLQSQKPIH